MYNLVIGIFFLVLLAYLSFYSKNDKFGVSVKYNLDGESEESEGDVTSNVTSNVTGGNVTGGKCKEVKSGGLHILMHHIKGVANIFAPEIKIDA